MENQTTFDARFVSFRAVRKYRVYARRSDFFFIEIPGVTEAADALTMHLGLIGLLIRRSMQKKAQQKAEIFFQSTANQNPEELLRQNKNNFTVHIPEIQDSSIDPPKLFTVHGEQAGRWSFSTRNGKKMHFEFEQKDQMKSAMNVLPQLLHGTLKVNTEWNGAKNKFQKIKGYS